jgi:peptide-methionine (S)-S-oxide reductase
MTTIFSASCATGVDNEKLPAPAADIPLSPEPKVQQAVVAGGCFWCTEAVFEQVPGVQDVVSGYSGGTRETANYEAVCSGNTAHAEAIEITYDASRVSFGRLLQVFFNSHDPTTLNRQGPDAGRQYRSAIFYRNDDERRVAEGYIRQLSEAKVFCKPIVTTLEPLTEFFPAEKYHQNYARLNPLQPYIQRYATPKAAKMKKLFGPAAATQPATQPAARSQP